MGRLQGEPDDPYQVLQVHPGAEREVIEAAYRALARKYHPDVNRDAQAQQRIRAINEAYTVLHDDGRRAGLDFRRQTAATSSRAEAERVRPRPPDRPIDLLAALVAYRWRAARVRMSRQVSLGALVIIAALLATMAALVVARGADPALAGYWRAAAAARAQVEATRQRYYEALGAGDPDSAYPVAVAGPTYPNVATQLAADLSSASDRLRAYRQAVPKPAELYHLAQLDDWREERALRLAYRDAAVARKPDLWQQTAAREAVWRASPAHQRVETLAWQLAARAAGNR